MPVTFFIVGPTAVGKSSLAVEVAARCGAEIVGADAFQIYAGFDLLTAKPSAVERAKVTHHLVGTISPEEAYNVARYRQDAQACLEAIHQRGKPALVVGGTGLYVKALTHGLSPLPEADPVLRAELEVLDASVLLTRLRTLDPVSAATIDTHNKRRLIRALEVCVLTGRPFSSHRTLWDTPPKRQINGVFLTRPKIDRQARITQRVANMFDRGVIEEVATAQNLTLSATASKMIGWEEIQTCLGGRQTLAECQERMVVSTRQYAKRQITWFQREECFERVDLATFSNEQAADLLCARLHSVRSDEPLPRLAFQDFPPRT